MKGRALLLCPVTSNGDLLRYGEAIVHINAEISHSALYLSVTKQKLVGAQISWCTRLEDHASCQAMSAFTVAIRCKADIPFCNVCF